MLYKYPRQVLYCNPGIMQYFATVSGLPFNICLNEDLTNVREGRLKYKDVKKAAPAHFAQGAATITSILAIQDIVTKFRLSAGGQAKRRS